MKKKVLLGLLIFVGLFIITGCDKNGESSLNANSEKKLTHVKILATQVD